MINRMVMILPNVVNDNVLKVLPLIKAWRGTLLYRKQNIPSTIKLMGYFAVKSDEIITFDRYVLKACPLKNYLASLSLSDGVKKLSMISPIKVIVMPSTGKK
ncbi:hypothetical protein C5L34_000341 [Lentilactobacillus hilgardii]|nr:hypothetical protein C5L34_000341 [Lentilactobacillus hilgardii]